MRPVRFRSAWSVVALIGALLVAPAVSVAPASAAPAPTAPVPGPPPAAATPALDGANDWACRPSAAHPRPVVLVHGTWSSVTDTWDVLAPALKKQGYCVFALDYGKREPDSLQNLLNLAGGDAISRSAGTLAQFVTRVRTATRAAQVDIVGHSQGALVARQYLKFNGGTDAKNPSRNAVHTLVSLAGTNHGTTFNFNQLIGLAGQALGIPVVTLAATAVGPSYIEQMIGSPFLRRLNDGGDTRPGVDYVAVGSRNDNVVTPTVSTFLTAGPGATVRNVWVQTGCPALVVDHMTITSAPRAVWIVQDALDPGFARTTKAPCA